MSKPVKEGWMTAHPITGKVVEVVPAAYCLAVEDENRAMKMVLAVLARRNGGVVEVTEGELTRTDGTLRWQHIESQGRFRVENIEREARPR